LRELADSDLPPADVMVSEPSRRQIVERARWLLDEGRDVENLDLLSRAVDRYPEDPEIRLLYGISLIPSRPHDAPWQLATAIKLDPDDPSRLVRAASMLYYLGEIEAARSYAARAAQLAPADFPLLPDLTNLGGNLAAGREDYALAEEALKTAAELCPGRPDFAYDLAKFLARQGRGSDAVKVIEQATAQLGRPLKPRDARDFERLSNLRAQIDSESG
jgi:tetratricopeptide (TPR) repeat protein